MDTVENLRSSVTLPLGIRSTHGANAVRRVAVNGTLNKAGSNVIVARTHVVGRGDRSADAGFSGIAW